MGKYHPEVATVYHNLGLAYADIDDYSKAIDFHQNALDIFLKFDPKHPDIANSYNNLGVAYSGLKEYVKAVEHYKMALEFIKKKLSNSHPHKKIIMNNLKDAKNLFKQSLNL